MKITDFTIADGQGAYYVEDLAAFQSETCNDKYLAKAVTPGFLHAREVAEVLSLGLMSSDQIGWGDCVGVSYAGQAGREGVFRREAMKPILTDLVQKKFIGCAVNTFRELDASIPEDLPAALKYGVSQALLSLVAQVQKKMPCEVLAEEWNLPLLLEPLFLQGSAGEKRIENADKMIFNQLDVLPHGQVDDIPNQVGENGDKLLEYAKGLVRRIRDLQPNHYHPMIHLDVHGALREVFGGDLERIAAFLVHLEDVFHPLPLRMESVVIGRTCFEHVELHRQLKAALKTRGSRVELFIDEWATCVDDIVHFLEAGVCDGIHIKMPNLGTLSSTLEAVMLCQQRGVKALLGGSCIETDISSRLSLHVAMATRPDSFLVKPGMGIDEGISAVRNEMARVLSVLRKKGLTHGNR